MSEQKKPVTIRILGDLKDWDENIERVQVHAQQTEREVIDLTAFTTTRTEAIVTDMEQIEQAVHDLQRKRSLTREQWDELFTTLQTDLLRAKQKVVELGHATTAQTQRTDAEVQIQHRRLDILQQTAHATSQGVLVTVNASLAMLNSLTCVVRGVATMIGATIDPLFDIVLQIISSTVATLMAAVTAYASNPVTAWLAVITGAVALIFNVTAIASMQAGRQQAESQFRATEQVLNQIQGMLNF